MDFQVKIRRFSKFRAQQATGASPEEVVKYPITSRSSSYVRQSWDFQHNTTLSANSKRSGPPAPTSLKEEVEYLFTSNVLDFIRRHRDFRGNTAFSAPQNCERAAGTILREEIISFRQLSTTGAAIFKSL
jgi:hypothetical protein